MSFPPTTRRTHVVLDTLEELNMIYPKTGAKRHRELLSIRKRLAK